MTAAILRLLARLRLVTPALRFSPPDDGSLRRLTPRADLEGAENVAHCRDYGGMDRNAWRPPDDDFRTALIREGAEP